MENARFAHLMRSFALMRSRRTLASALGLAAIALSDLTEAKKHKHKNRHKKNKKIKRNEFGCVNVGKFCKHDGQCCSGICQGKKDKKTCKAHDTGSCQPGSEFPACGGDPVDCTTSGGSAGLCATTTGNAGYCVNAIPIDSPLCSKDAECQAALGSPTAACIRCATGDPFCVNAISV